MPEARIGLFGEPSLEVDGVPRKIRRRKVAALLAYLAVEPRPHGRDELAELLYPRLRRDRAYADFRQSLSYLKAELGDGVVDVDAQTVALLSSAGVRVDVAEFRTHLWQACGSGELDHLRSAVALYRGPFLGGFFLRDSPAFEQWQFQMAEELRRECGSALARLHDLHVERGALDQAVECARSIVALDRLDEAAQRRLMRTLAASGKRREALRQFEAFRDLLDRELAAEPDDETRGLLAAIRSGSHGSKAGAIRSRPARSAVALGVLPFDDLSEDSGQEYFCDGLTEDLTTALTAVPDLRIIARSTMFAFKGKRPDPRQLGRDLEVSHVLEGSVRKAGTRIRVNVQLIETGRGENLWAKKFDKDLAGVFEIQDDIVRSVVTELDVRLARGEQVRLWRGSTDNAEAYDLFLRARSCAVNPEGLAREMALLERVLELDPKFTAALCYVGYIAMLQAHLGWVRDVERAVQKAGAAFQAALRLDDRCADAHAGLGMMLYRQRRLEEAEKEYELALSLGPILESTHTVCAGFYACKKDFLRALHLVRRAKELSRFPLSQTWAWEIVCLRSLNRLEEAVAVSRRALELFPDGVDILVNHANVCRLLQLQEEVDACLKRVLELQPDFTAERWVAATGAFDEQEQREYVAALRRAGFP